MTTDDAMTNDTVAALEILTNEFFLAVSFADGARPNYDRLHGLFIVDGKLIKNSSESPEITTVDQFIAPRQAMVESGALTAFREWETANITEVFGNVAHRFSTYEKRGVMDGVQFEGKGVISTQFVRTPSGWKMSSMAWDDERPGLSIPDRYLRPTRPVRQADVPHQAATTESADPPAASELEGRSAG